MKEFERIEKTRSSCSYASSSVLHSLYMGDEKNINKTACGCPTTVVKKGIIMASTRVMSVYII